MLYLFYLNIIFAIALLKNEEFGCNLISKCLSKITAKILCNFK